MNQEDSEQNEVDGMKKEADSTVKVTKVMHNNYVKDRLVICNEEDTDGRAISHEMIYHYKCRSLRYSYIFTNSFN